MSLVKVRLANVRLSKEAILVDNGIKVTNITKLKQTV
jgi:hypothetical protein